MRIFLDTEFTNFPKEDCDLISIGLVDENGRTFYAELTDFRQEACSDFVKQVVLPLLKQHKDCITGNRFQVGSALEKWLEVYKDEPECIICYDYQADWDLMCGLLEPLTLGEPPFINFLKGEIIWGNINQMALEYFWLEHDAFGWKPHQALWDAMANRYAYKPSIEQNV